MYKLASYEIAVYDGSRLVDELMSELTHLDRRLKGILEHIVTDEGYSKGVQQWRTRNQDMIYFSKLFPYLTFALYIDDDRSDLCTCVYYKNGIPYRTAPF